MPLEQKRERMLLEKEIDSCYIDANEIERVQRERKNNLIAVRTGRARTKEYKYSETL